MLIAGSQRAGLLHQSMVGMSEAGRRGRCCQQLLRFGRLARRQERLAAAHGDFGGQRVLGKLLEEGGKGRRGFGRFAQRLLSDALGVNASGTSLLCGWALASCA